MEARRRAELRCAESIKLTNLRRFGRAEKNQYGDPRAHCVFLRQTGNVRSRSNPAASDPVSSERLANGVVKRGPDLPDELALTIGPGAVGEQNDCHSGFEVDPKRAAAVAQVTDGRSGKMPSRRRILTGRIPAERARAACGRLA